MMPRDEAELNKALEESMLSGRCIADIARERGLKPQKLYALRYKMKNNSNVHVAQNCESTSNNELIDSIDINEKTSRSKSEEITLEFNGLRIIIGPMVSARRVAAIVAALKSEKSI